MERVTSHDGTAVSYDRYGDGPPLVLVHGGFSDHETNWTYAKPLLSPRFKVHAVARRGRGETAATAGHTIADEAADVAAVVRAAGEPVFLLGHSYGALCALEAAALAPGRVAALVLYEAPGPELVDADKVARLQQHGESADWDGMVRSFLRESLQVPDEDVAALRASPDWAPWIADAPATLGDLQALVRYSLEPERYRTLGMPVLLLVGTESPRELYATDTLAAALPDVRVVALEGQAHEGMTTAPEQFVEAVTGFLLGGGLAGPAADEVGADTAR